MIDYEYALLTVESTWWINMMLLPMIAVDISPAINLCITHMEIIWTWLSYNTVLF